MNPDSQSLTLRRPDDWHLHLRDGAMLATVLPFTVERFGRAMVMPNLEVPVTSPARARDYRARIAAAVPEGARFTPLMTCYLTDDTEPEVMVEAYRNGIFAAAKLYPANVTTGAQAGVTDMARIAKLLEAMEEADMVLLVHGEVADPDVDPFDRETVFIDRVLAPLRRSFPGLRVVLEHVTTEDAVAFVAESNARTAATITPHHLVINRGAMFAGGLRPHFYCLPVAKRERHRQALRQAATLGEPSFFLGTDSAPHADRAKFGSCGCAGIFNAPVALEVYAQVFEEEGALDRLEDFASVFGPRFYGLAANEGTVTLERTPWQVPAMVPVAVPGADGDVLTPFMGGETVNWRLKP